jgi:hypothetical protein
MFDDGLRRLEAVEDLVSKLRYETTCNLTKELIEDFLS